MPLVEFLTSSPTHVCCAHSAEHDVCCLQSLAMTAKTNTITHNKKRQRASASQRFQSTFRQSRKNSTIERRAPEFSALTRHL